MGPKRLSAKATLSRPTAEPLVFDNAGDDPMAVALLEAMSDATSRAILASITPVGMSIEEITEANGFPISTAYRRVHQMTKNGLIVVERVVSGATGKRRAIYRSTFRGVKIGLGFDRVRVEGLPNDALPDITFRMWRFAESRQQHE